MMNTQDSDRQCFEQPCLPPQGQGCRQRGRSPEIAPNFCSQGEEMCDTLTYSEVAFAWVYLPGRNENGSKMVVMLNTSMIHEYIAAEAVCSTVQP